MKLDLTQVQHIAELAKLELSPEETTQFQEQLSEILEYFEVLDQLDTTAIPPTALIGNQVNVLRADQAAPSLPVDQVLANAPRCLEQYIIVKTILE